MKWEDSYLISGVANIASLEKRMHIRGRKQSGCEWENPESNLFE